jgi:hypothetical protein
MWAVAMLAGLFIQTAPAGVVLSFTGTAQGPFSLSELPDPAAPSEAFSLILNMNGSVIESGVYSRGALARDIIGGTLTGGLHQKDQLFSLVFETPDTTELELSVGSRVNELEGFGASDWNRFFAGPAVSGLYEENMAADFYFIGELTTATAVPEPASWGMMVAIVAGVAGLRWRTTKKGNPGCLDADALQADQQPGTV